VTVKYLGTTVTNQNLIREKMKRILNSGSDCYNSFHNILLSRLLSKNIKIRVYKPRILSVVLHGYESWSLTLREEHRLRVFENWVLRRIFGPKRDEVSGWWRELPDKELHNMYSLPSVIRMLKSRRMK
jgi:hypothetical protein